MKLAPIVAFCTVLGCRPAVAPQRHECDTALFSPIADLDAADRVLVKKRGEEPCRGEHDWSTDAEQFLFAETPAPVSETYRRVATLCNRLDSGQASEADIDALIADAAQRAPVRYALTVTGTSLEGFRRTWFGAGRGFHHVLCGEPSRRPSRFSGYHFWHRFYEEERSKRVNYRCSVQLFPEEPVAAVRFERTTPTGAVLTKRISSFTLGESPAALLALGHIATVKQCDMRKKGADFVADIGGGPQPWSLSVKAGSLTTMYPLPDAKPFVRTKSADEIYR